MVFLKAQKKAQNNGLYPKMLAQKFIGVKLAVLVIF